MLSPATRRPPNRDDPPFGPGAGAKARKGRPRPLKGKAARPAGLRGTSAPAKRAACPLDYEMELRSPVGRRKPAVLRNRYAQLLRLSNDHVFRRNAELTKHGIEVIQVERNVERWNVALDLVFFQIQE